MIETIDNNINISNNNNVMYYYNDNERLNHNLNDLYVQINKNYDNLKEEILCNTCCKISNEQWLDLWEKANDFIQCESLIYMTSNDNVDDDYKGIKYVQKSFKYLM